MTVGYPSHPGSSHIWRALLYRSPFPWTVTSINSGDWDGDPIGEEHHSTSYVSDCTQESDQAKERICAGLGRQDGSIAAGAAADIPCDGAELEGRRGPG